MILYNGRSLPNTGCLTLGVDLLFLLLILSHMDELYSLQLRA